MRDIIQSFYGVELKLTKRTSSEITQYLEQNYASINSYGVYANIITCV